MDARNLVLLIANFILESGFGSRGMEKTLPICRINWLSHMVGTSEVIIDNVMPKVGRIDVYVVSEKCIGDVWW